jgi:hypothetical protein
VSPAGLLQGQSGSVSITGTGFTGATVVSFGSDVAVDSFTVDALGQITATITISSSAAVGPRDVSVTNSYGTGIMTGGFRVYGPPTIVNLAPDHGGQGQTLSVVVTGTSLVEPLAVSFDSSGITVNSYTVNSATQITVSITIGSSAALGTRDVSVTTPGGTATLTGGFTVHPPPPPPTIVSIGPDHGGQ